MIHITYLIIDFIVRGIIVAFVALIIYGEDESNKVIDKIFYYPNRAYFFASKVFKIKAVSHVDNILLGFLIGYFLTDIITKSIK